MRGRTPLLSCVTFGKEVYTVGKKKKKTEHGKEGRKRYIKEICKLGWGVPQACIRSKKSLEEECVMEFSNLLSNVS